MTPKLGIFLLPPPRCWNYKRTPLGLVYTVLETVPGVSYVQGKPVHYPVSHVPTFPAQLCHCPDYTSLCVSHMALGDAGVIQDDDSID